MKPIFLAGCLLCLTFPLHADSGTSYFDYLHGLLQERAGDNAKALDSYKKVVQEDPTALEAYRDIASLELRLGKPEAALSAAQHIKELAPNDPTTFIFLGNIYVAQGDLAKAAESYEDALKIDPNNLRALENLGNYYGILDPEKALSYYQRYLDLDSRDPEIYFQMAILQQKRGKTTEAVDLFKHSIEIDPQEPASHMGLAGLYEDQKSTDAAIAEYNVAAELQPTNPFVYLRLGNLYYQESKWDDAQEAYQKVAEFSPKEPAVYYWLARIAEEKKDWKQAAKSAEKAYDLSKDAQFLPLIAYYLTLDNQTAASIPYLEKAVAQDPKIPNAYLFLGMNKLELGKVQEAYDALKKGVELFPNDAQMHYQLGMALDRLGKMDDSTAEFQKVISLDPKNAAAMNYLGYSWADRGVHLEEAEKLLRQAVQLEPTSGAYWDSLGWVRYKRGDAHAARSLLEKAVFLTPDPLIYDHLGDAAIADQRPEEAMQAWSAALSLDPKNDAIQKKIQDESARFKGSPDEKRYLRYLEGNLKQVQNLQSDMAFVGRMHKHSIHAQGKLSYEQPDRMKLNVEPTAKSGPLQFLLQGAMQQVDPEAISPLLRQLAFDGLSSLSDFLSGRMTHQLKTIVTSKSGIQTEFSKPNPSGGNDIVRVVSYDFVEGIWLPAEMRLTNETTGWEATLKFSNWVINDPATSAR